jgi:hypothetical protein
MQQSYFIAIAFMAFTLHEIISAVASSIIGGRIFISLCSALWIYFEIMNRLFLWSVNTNIWICPPPPQLSSLLRHCNQTLSSFVWCRTQPMHHFNHWSIGWIKISLTCIALFTLSVCTIRAVIRYLVPCSVGSTNVKMLCWVDILLPEKKQAETRRFEQRPFVKFRRVSACFFQVVI